VGSYLNTHIFSSVYKKNAISYTQTSISQILDNEMAGRRSRLIPNGLK